MKIADAAALALKEEPDALHVRDIHARITSLGLFEFKAADPASVVASTLHKDKRFLKTAPSTFRLVSPITN